MMSSMTFLVEAGRVREDDDTVALIQGLSVGQASLVADWLAVTTGGMVKIRFVAPGVGSADVVRWPDNAPRQG